MFPNTPYEFIGFGAMDVTKPYEFIGFGVVGHVAHGPHTVLRVDAWCSTRR
jgi:hypothetical protein